MYEVRWADAELESVTYTYDLVRIVVRETAGRLVSVEGHGPVGLEVEGFWDEAVISEADLIENHPFADRCWRSIESRLGIEPPVSGSPDRNLKSFKTLVIALADGCYIRVAAARFTAEPLVSA